MQKIEGKIREEFKDQKTAQRIRGIQEYERLHLEKRVSINDKMVKMAQQMYELNKKRFIEHDEEIDAYYIETFAAERVAEIDQIKREESSVLSEINEQVEGLRRRYIEGGALDKD